MAFTPGGSGSWGEVNRVVELKFLVCLSKIFGEVYNIPLL